MKNNKMLDLYTDYLLSSFSYTTSTGLSELSDGAISHDKVTRFLRWEEYTSKDLWKQSKSLVREVESEEGVMIIDDSIENKQYTDENDIICWHFDHAKGRAVKGINFITSLYYSKGYSIPVGYEIVEKTEKYTDPKDGKEKRRSTRTKNEIFRDLLNSCVQNRILFTFVLADIWYASAENMVYIKKKVHKDFIMPLKSNRKLALSKEDREKGKWVKLESVDIKQNSIKEIFLEGVEFPLLLCKQIFTNDDGSTGILYLVCSDVSQTYDSMTTIYKKRWKVEEYHKSLKCNACLEKSPTKTRRTQANHFFASLCAFIKLEKLKMSEKRNHFALKARLYINALKSAYSELQKQKINAELNNISFVNA